MKTIDKVIRNGNVAVLFSPGYGAGWSTWNTDYKQLIFHPKVVEMVENGRQNEIDDEWVKENLGITGYICTLGASQLRIQWLPEGSLFRIDEYDGCESITTSDELYFTA